MQVLPAARDPAYHSHHVPLTHRENIPARQFTIVVVNLFSGSMSISNHLDWLSVPHVYVPIDDMNFAETPHHVCQHDVNKLSTVQFRTLVMDRAGFRAGESVEQRWSDFCVDHVMLVWSGVPCQYYRCRSLTRPPIRRLPRFMIARCKKFELRVTSACAFAVG